VFPKMSAREPLLPWKITMEPQILPHVQCPDDRHQKLQSYISDLLRITDVKTHCMIVP
jgi:hypothetical protein